MAIVLGANQYGKAEVRLLHVSREGASQEGTSQEVPAGTVPAGHWGTTILLT